MAMKKKQPRARASKQEPLKVELVPPGSVNLGGGLMLPGGVAFAVQADRPEMLTPGLAGAGTWSEAEQRGVLGLLQDLLVQRAGLRSQLEVTDRRARESARWLCSILDDAAEAVRGLKRPDEDDLDDDGDMEDGW